MKYNLLGQRGPEGQTNPAAPEGGPYIYDGPPGVGDNKGLSAKGTPVDSAGHQDKINQSTSENNNQQEETTTKEVPGYVKDYESLIKNFKPGTEEWKKEVFSIAGRYGVSGQQIISEYAQYATGPVDTEELNSYLEDANLPGDNNTTQSTTMYWGRYDSGSWATSTLDGKPDGFSWGWELPEYEGLGKDAFTSDKDLNDILKSTTDGSGAGGGGTTTTTTTTTEVSKGFQDTQLWQVGGETYVVFSVPETEPPLYIRYLATEDLLDLYYSSGRERPDVRNVSKDSDDWINSSYFGKLAEVDKDILSGAKEPFTGLVEKWDKAKEYRPWLDDTELYNIWLEAFIEDRDISDEEWKTTDWWRTHTKEERDWLLLSQGKDLDKLPADAQAYLNNNKIKLRDMFIAAGVSNIDSIVNTNGESFLDWFAFNFTSGVWTETFTMDQLKGIADPSTGIEIDESVSTWLEGKAQGVDVATTKRYEAQVENLANEWLGPLYGVLTDDQKANYAGMIRNAETAEVGADMVIDKLKGIRGTLFGDYDENLTYNEIATPWRNYSFQLLGQRMDETDATFVDVIKANDQKTATQLLTEWGINNNSATLLDKVTDEMSPIVGAGQVVRGLAT